MENTKRTTHKICGKSLAVILTATMVVSVATASSVSVSASYYPQHSNIYEHTVGVIGNFAECEKWTKDIPMTDDDGDGIYEAWITGQEAGDYEFKVRLDGSWENSWGEYEAENDRIHTSQVNCEVTVNSESDVIKVTFDTTSVSEQALAQSDSYAHYISDIEDPNAFNYWPVSYEVFEEKTYKDLRYIVIDDENVTITGYNESGSRNIVIPSEIEGITVTEINGNYGNMSYIDLGDDFCKSFLIPSSVTKIENVSFMCLCMDDGNHLVVFGESGSAAESFAKSKGYIFCAIPTNAVTSGDYIYTVLDDGKIEINKYSGKEKNLNVPSKIDGKSVKQIGEYAFVGCDAESVTIPGTIEVIGMYSFEGSSIKKVTIENGVKDIDGGAFLGSRFLTDVSIPDTATVSSLSFVCTPWYNSQTDEFVIVGDHTLIKYNGEGGNIKIPDGVKIISSIFAYSDLYSWEFYNDTVTSIDIPDSVEGIWGNAFSGCVNLKEIVIPDSVKEIGGASFFYCTSLEKVYIPENVTVMNQNNTFLNCPNVSIYGVKGSRAESYANENDIPFIEWVRNDNNDNTDNSNTDDNNDNTDNSNTDNNNDNTGNSDTNNNTDNNNNNTTNNNDTPATGENGMYVFMAAIFVAISGITAVILSKTKRRKNEQ